jgi:hypothetical protein
VFVTPDVWLFIAKSDGWSKRSGKK